MSEIIRGISEVNPEEQVVIANYRPIADETEGIHVVEIANTRAKHMNDKLLVFGRWITHQELSKRKIEYQENPEQYKLNHLKSLSQ